MKSLVVPRRSALAPEEISLKRRERTSGLNLTSWNYIGHDPKQFRHYGPVAQEFFGAFGHDAVGTIGNSTTINSGDMEGILMVAVQALEKRTGEFHRENEALKAENTELKARLKAIERRLSGNTNHRSH